MPTVSSGKSVTPINSHSLPPSHPSPSPFLKDASNKSVKKSLNSIYKTVLELEGGKRERSRIASFFLFFRKFFF